MEFRTGTDYPWMCAECRAAVDECAEEIAERVALGAEDMVSGRVLLDLGDNEAPSMLAYDRGMFCGWGECECDCSLGFPRLAPELDVLCPVHGGTEEEQQAFYAQECEKNGHHFPYMRDGYCLSCRKAYGQAEQIVV
jgi:hypothetical protein